MSEINKLKEWRAEEIVKIFLLRSNLELEVERFPTPLFDFFVKLKSNPDIKFAIEVKTKQRFKAKINTQINHLKSYREAGLITIPVLLIKVDEKLETSEFDFLVFPSFKENKLLIRYGFKFTKLNNDTFSNKINTIKKWYSDKSSK